MNNSTNQDRGNSAKTKAELNKELNQTKKDLEQSQADCNGLQEQVSILEMRLNEVQAKLKDRSEQADELQQDVEELKRIQKNVQNENKELKQKIQDMSRSSVDTSELESIKEKLNVALKEKLGAAFKEKLGAAMQRYEDAAQARKKAESKVKELENTILELESKLIDTEKNNLNETKEIPTSKATFRIYVFPGEGDYQGTIEHLPSNARRNFKKLNQNLIFEFIAKHLPQQFPEEEIILSPPAPSTASTIDESLKLHPDPDKPRSIGTKKPEIPSRMGRDKSQIPSRSVGMPKEQGFEDLDTKVKPAKKQSIQESISDKKKVLEEIQFEQFRRILEKGATLRARQPFNIHIRLRFPVVPSDRNMQIDTSAYTVQVMMKNFETKNVIERNRVTDTLSPRITKYRNRISIPGMEPGKYLLTFYTFAPFANVEESKQLEVAIQ